MATQVRKSASDGASSWQQGFGGSSAKYQSGVQNVKTAPGTMAAAASAKWQANVSSAAAKSRFETGSSAVTLQAWQQAATTRGVQNLSAGATKGLPKYTAFAQKFYPVLSQNMATVAAMPSTTLQDNIQRAVTMMTLNSKFKAS